MHFLCQSQSDKKINNGLLCFRATTSNSEKRPLEKESDDASDGEEKRKKQRTDDEPTKKVTESILDDIRLEDIESRITVHVLDSPESCTHEVAVYPGKIRYDASCVIRI